MNKFRSMSYSQLNKKRYLRQHNTPQQAPQQLLSQIKVPTFETPIKRVTQSAGQKKPKKRQLVEMSGRHCENEDFDSKELLRSLIQEKKHHQKLLMFKDIRNRVKESKEKSKGRSSSKSNERIALSFSNYSPQKSMNTPQGGSQRTKPISPPKNNFLPQNSRESKQASAQKVEQSSQVLYLLNIPQSEIKKSLKQKCHQEKRKQELAKLKNKFPKGFFQF